jgi:RsiW-degrading membrane proteinase PrsW (M82 family)
MFLQVILPIILCFVPVIIAALIIYRFEIKVLHILTAIIIGLVAILPISLIQYFINTQRIFHNIMTTPILYYLVSSLIVYGFIEETFKSGFAALVPHKNYSILQQTLLIGLMGLSLAGFENVVYFMDLFQKASNKGAQLIYTQIFARFFTADIIHFTCTAICGMFIISLRDKNLRTRWGFFLTAFLLHGAYDFFACFQNNLKWFQIPVILLAIVETRIKYKTLTTPDEEK